MYRKNTSGQFIHFQGVDASTGGIKSGVTWTVRSCIDGTFAAGGGTVTEDGTAGWYKYAMSQADTNGNNIGFNFTGTGAVPQTVNITTDGSPPDVNLKNAAGTAVTLDSNNVLNVSTKYLAGTALTGRDIGASVLLSTGTGTGQLDFTSGVVKANLAQILGTALTETAGQIAAAFKKFFNIATPASTMDALTLVTTATNLTNAPTAGDFTATMKTSIGTAVAASAVASVTGNVGGNVVGTVASVVGNVGGNVTGSVGSVVGAVGSVTGAVGSVTGLTASDVGAIKTQTDKLTFTVANQVDSNAKSMNGTAILGTGTGADLWRGS